MAQGSNCKNFLSDLTVAFSHSKTLPSNDLTLDAIKWIVGKLLNLKGCMWNTSTNSYHCDKVLKKKKRKKKAENLVKLIFVDQFFEKYAVIFTLWWFRKCVKVKLKIKVIWQLSTKLSSNY